jgi:hypothetical protein
MSIVGMRGGLVRLSGVGAAMTMMVGRLGWLQR